MSALDNVPKNLNFLSNLGFRLWLKRAPNTVYDLFKVTIPGLSLPVTKQDTPFVPIVLPGDHVTFQPLVASFLVDENLTNYLEIHSWMRNLAKADDFQEFASLKKNPNYTGIGITSEIIVTILDAARNPKMIFTFHDCMPTDLSGLVFDSSETDVTYLKANVVFAYTNYDYQQVV